MMKWFTRWRPGRSLFLWSIFGLFVMSASITVYAMVTLPDNVFNPTESYEPLQILDRDGKNIATLRHYQTKIESLHDNRFLLPAVIATEDREFWSHHGINSRGIIRAILLALRRGRIDQGGSSITEQYVRSFKDEDRRTLRSKCITMIQAMIVERLMSKDDIITGYLQSAYFGQHAYGVEEAAMTYAGSSVSHLSLAQTALIIGLLKGPSVLNPYINLRGALDRRTIVLQSMLEEGFITQEDYATALAEDFKPMTIDIPAHAQHVVQRVSLMKDEHTSRTLVTSIDLAVQKEVEEIVTNEVLKLQEKNVGSAAVVVMDATSGEILSYVGSADFSRDDIDGQFDAASSPRQPGSTLKPFVYALALSRGILTASSTLHDVADHYATAEGTLYSPKNYDYEEHGLTRVREALGNSYNIPAVKTLQMVGVDSLIQFLSSAGISSIRRDAEHYGLGLALGDAEVSLLELTQAYAMLANGGITVTPNFLLNDTKKTGTRILDARVAWILSNILADPSARLQQFGPQSPLNFTFPVAVKTGTTRNSRDNWTVGYTPSIVVGVWVGNPSNEPMKGTSGVTGAGPIFHRVMEAASRRYPGGAFLRPTGIVEKDACALSGDLPTPLCGPRIHEYYLSEFAPTKTDDIVRSVFLSRDNQYTVPDDCSISHENEKTIVYDFPQDLRRWAAEKGLRVMPPIHPECEQTNRSTKNVKQGLQIESPTDRSVMRLDPTIPDEYQKMLLRATISSAEKILWSIDGTDVAITESSKHALVPLEKGKQTIRARSESGRWTDEVKVTVQ